jgi:hypothetical protein
LPEKENRAENSAIAKLQNDLERLKKICKVDDTLVIVVFGLFFISIHKILIINYLI